MRLSLEYIAGIEKADIKFDGLTVITGENSTGKSTIGKVLNSVFATFKSADNSLKSYLIHTVSNELTKFADEYNEDDYVIIDGEESGEYLDGLLKKLELNFEGVVSNIYELYMEDGLDKNAMPKSKVEEYLRSAFEKFYLMDQELIFIEDQEEYEYNEDDEGIPVSGIELKKTPVYFVESTYFDNLIIGLPNSVEDYFSRLFNRHLRFSLPESKNLTYDKYGSISLNIQNRRINIKHGKVEEYINIKNKSFFVDSEYIYSNRTRRTFSRINKSDNTTMNAEYKIDNILTRINHILHNSMTVTDSKSGEQKELPYNGISVAFGLKLIFILKEMLVSGSLEYKDVIILDEPEIHVHPKLQVELAQILYEMQKAFDLTMVITTHSPYFITALMAIMDKEREKEIFNAYNMSGKPGCFKSEHINGNLSSVLSDMASAYKEIDRLFLQREFGEVTKND